MESKTYYRSIKRRIEYEKTAQDANQPKTDALKKPSKAVRFDMSDFYIPKLPKRLKKGLWGNLDYRFLGILLASFIFNILFVFILYRNTSFEMNEEKLNRYHENLARLILETSDEMAKQEKNLSHIYINVATASVNAS